MKQIGNLIIVLGIIVTFISIGLLINNFNNVDESCAKKGGLMVKGSNGWICAKVEKL